MRRAGRIFAASDGGKPGALPASGDARAEPVAAFGPFHDLPSSLVAEVIALLDGPSVAKLGMTCRRMREETRSSAIWRTLARRQEPSALVREDLYLNIEAPFDPLFRKADSTWALATEEELEKGLTWLRAKIEAGEGDKFLAEREAIRAKVGQTTTVVTRKPM